MADINTITNELNRKKHIDKNIPLYFDNMMSLYNRMSSIKLSMNLFTFLDKLSDSDKKYPDSFSEDIKTLKSILNKCIVTDDNNSEIDIAYDTLISMRANITAIMENITAYVDKFAIYEHILNRIEFKFDNSSFDDNYYNNKFSSDIMSYICQDDDSVVVNAKISDIVCQLPMRLTKKKFFDLIHDSLSIYKGSDKSSLDDFLYMLNTVSGIYNSESKEELFDEIVGYLEQLNSFNYKEISYEDYNKALNILTISMEWLTKTSDSYVELVELINDAIIILLSKKYAFCDTSERNYSLDIIRELSESDFDKLSDSEYDSISEKFILFEGKQEKIYHIITTNDYMIDEINNAYIDDINRLGLNAKLNDMTIVQKLSSGSIFISLNGNNTDKTECDDSYIEEVFNKYYESTVSLFSEHTQIFNRAVMSLVLSSLPVFFNNINEVSEYVKTSLLQCNDIAEKKACVNIIRMLMNE